jgi:pimeloyl-ACP methyl ester carboxylesterase
MKQESTMLVVNGMRMHVVSAGQGPPVLLLHGFPDTSVVWRKQIGVLADAGFRVIAPDLRGYGDTDAPSAVAAYTLEHLCADVLGLLDVLGIDRARVVGHDWGALIGWRLCMYMPARVECFVALSVGHPSAVAGAGLTQWLRLSYVLLFRVPGVAEWVLRASNWLVLRKMTRDRTQVGHWRRCLRPRGRLTAALNYYRANLRFGLLREWQPVSVPVMGIWSDGDAVLGEQQMRGSARYALGGFRYERVAGADHWLQLTAPDRVNELLLDYLNEEGTYSAAS